MKVLIALAVVALAAADSDSFYPGFHPYRHQASAGFPFVGQHFAGQYQPYGYQHQQFPFLPYHQQQHQRLFRRDADSDSDSFYPGFPFVPPTPYYGQYHGQYQTPYFHQSASPYMHHRSLAMPVHHQQPYTTYSHPLMYNPLLKVAQVKDEVKEHKVQKRESESDSFYPGFPFMPPTPYFGQYHGQYQTPYQTPYQVPQTYGLPSVVPRVLPYNFPGMYNGYQAPVVSTYKTVAEEKKLE